MSVLETMRESEKAAKLKHPLVFRLAKWCVISIIVGFLSVLLTLVGQSSDLKIVSVIAMILAVFSIVFGLVMIVALFVLLLKIFLGKIGKVIGRD